MSKPDQLKRSRRNKVRTPDLEKKMARFDREHATVIPEMQLEPDSEEPVEPTPSPRSPPEYPLDVTAPILALLKEATDVPATEQPVVGDTAHRPFHRSLSSLPARSKIPPARGSAKPARTPLRQSPGSKLPTPRRGNDAPNSPIARKDHGGRTRQGTCFGIGPEVWGRATGGALDRAARFHDRPTTSGSRHGGICNRVQTLRRAACLAGHGKQSPCCTVCRFSPVS